jgi:leader peptidase (prepilin peptidase)/N-methyltransferase
VIPSSHCPKCKKALFWYDNIPLLSYVVLKGRCRSCGAPISPRYLIVEFSTALFFLWIWFYFGLTVQALITAVLFSLLLVATVVDLEHQIIPDEVSVGGLAIGLLFSALVPSLHEETIWWRGLIQSLIGMLVGGGLIYGTGVLGNLVFRKESMGGGDVKLIAMIGSFVGWQKVILVYLLAPILALPLGLFLKFVKRAEVIPYGPFLSLGGWISFLWGTQLISWYFGGW